MECPKEFDDIRPFYDSEFHDKMKVLVTEPGFEHAVRYVLRDINYELFCQELLTIDNKKDFQLLVMRSFLEGLTQKTTKGLTGNNLDVLDKAKSYTFMSNHRDIVLDASLLNLLLIRNGIKTSEIAIGNNLLIYDWISDLVRLNKSFIVKRDVGVRQMLDAARQLSGYIHFAITKKNESVWIAAVLDAVKHPTQHPGGVGNGFLFADLAARRVKVGDLHAQIVSGDLKAAAGAGGGLFKDQGDVLAGQLLIVADAGLFPGLQVSGQIEQLLDLGRGVVQKLQKAAIFQTHCILSSLCNAKCIFIR